MVIEIKDFCRIWNEYLSNTQINEIVLKYAHRRLAKLQLKAKMNKELKAGKIFDYQICDFSKNKEKISSDLIGDLVLAEFKESKYLDAFRYFIFDVALVCLKCPYKPDFQYTKLRSVF